LVVPDLEESVSRQTARQTTRNHIPSGISAIYRGGKLSGSDVSTDANEGAS
jgi:hypothetical protein